MSCAVAGPAARARVKNASPRPDLTPHQENDSVAAAVIAYAPVGGRRMYDCPVTMSVCQ